MTNVSISQLKANPAKVIAASLDYPVAIQNRNSTEAYVVGKDLFEKIERYIEDFVDSKIIEKTDFSKRKDLKDVMKDLGI
ncbi:MAG: type II toxin-antitoxin system Phd/YefM family antitoxin [Patescibacteria group bacterium]